MSLLTPRTTTRARAGMPIHLLWATVALGGLAQSLAGSAGALLAEQVSDSGRVAGLPQTVLVLGSAAAALALGWVTRRRGRASSLSVGLLGAAVGCIVVVGAGLATSLPGILVGMFLTGAGTAAVMLSRYAADELLPGRAGPRAIASVLAATTIGAVAGPNLLGPSASSAAWVGIPGLVGAYAVAAVAFLAAAMVARLVPTAPPTVAAPRAEPRPIRTARLAGDGMVGAIVLATANLVMVAVVTMAPVHLHHGGSSLALIGLVISVHIAGMFAPSVLSGRLADRVGSGSAALVALWLLVLACLIAALGESDALVLGSAMLVLGIGWNLALVSGSDLLVRAVPVTERPRREGYGEVVMGFGAALGGASSGFVAAAGGYATLALVGAAIAVLPLVGLATRPPLRPAPSTPTHLEEPACAPGGTCRPSHGHDVTA